MKWPSATLGELCDLRNGKAYNANDWSENGYPIIRIQNLNDPSKPFNHWPGTLQKQVHVKDGDLLLAWAGTPGTSFGAHIWKGPQGVLNQHIFKMAIDGSKLTKDWLKFCINIQILSLVSQAQGGVGLKHVTKGMVEGLNIPLPPLGEQKRIAAILDKADAIRRKLQQSLRLSDDFLRSVFLDMFGDPVTNPMGWPVLDLISIIGDTFRNGLSPSTSGKVPGQVLTLSAITSGAFAPQYLRDAMFDREPSRNQIVTKDTFLICRGNGNRSMVGIGVFPEADMPTVSFPDTMIACEIDPARTEPEYLQAMWSTKRVRNQIDAGARTTNGTFKVNQALLGGIDFPLPPLTLQKKFSCVAKALMSRAIQLSETATFSENLFSSLQQRAFRGEL